MGPESISTLAPDGFLFEQLKIRGLPSALTKVSVSIRGPFLLVQPGLVEKIEECTKLDMLLSGSDLLCCDDFKSKSILRLC